MPDDPLDRLPPLREVIARHGLAAKKSLGQNFLLDLNLTDKITRLGGPLRGKTILEIGPGPGGLTRSILKAGAKRVLAVERDRRSIEALAELADAADGRLQLLEADAMKIDESEHLTAPVTVVANLPYNLATLLLMKWLDRLALFDRFVLMFQKEVAERICAAPGGKAYGRLSVMCQWRLDCKKLFELPPSAFVPAPKVRSSVLLLTPRPVPLHAADPEALEQVVRAAFGQRRKMLRGALSGLFDDPLTALKAAGIDPSARAETLKISDFCRLAAVYKDR